MDYPFIDKIIKSYISDTNDDEKNFICYQKLIREDIEKLKEINYSLYEYIHTLDRREQQKLIYLLIDDTQKVEESISAVLLGGLAAGLTVMYSNKLQKLFTTISDKISKHFAKSNLEKKILYLNFNNCMDKCAISVKGFYHRKSLERSLFRDRSKLSDKPSPFQTDKSRKDADCLLNCYLDFITTVIAIFSNDYKRCLINTGVNERELDEKKILLYRTLKSNCYNIYVKLNDINSKFTDTLDLVYKHDLKSKQYWVSALHNKISEISSGRSIQPSSRNPQFLNPLK